MFFFLPNFFLLIEQLNLHRLYIYVFFSFFRHSRQTNTVLLFTLASSLTRHETDCSSKVGSLIGPLIRLLVGRLLSCLVPKTASPGFGSSFCLHKYLFARLHIFFYFIAFRLRHRVAPRAFPPGQLVAYIISVRVQLSGPRVIGRCTYYLIWVDSFNSGLIPQLPRPLSWGLLHNYLPSLRYLSR